MKKPGLNLPIVLLLLALLIVVFIRIRLLSIPLERDEGEFGYAGQLILQGIPPFKMFYTIKLPGIHAAYAVVIVLFGQSASGIHLGLLLLNLACVWLLYRLARRFLDVPGAVAAAGSYALLSTSPFVFGLAAHATHFVVAAALAGLLLLLRGEETGKPALFFCSGCLFGIACLMKQPGAMFGVFGFCLLVARGVRDREHWRMHSLRIVLFSIGVAAPLALTGVILWQAGVFRRFWFGPLSTPGCMPLSIVGPSAGGNLGISCSPCLGRPTVYFGSLPAWVWLLLPWSRENGARNFGWRVFWSFQSRPFPFRIIFRNITSSCCCRRCACWRARRSVPRCNGARHGPPCPPAWSC